MRITVDAGRSAVSQHDSASELAVQRVNFCKRAEERLDIVDERRIDVRQRGAGPISSSARWWGKGLRSAPISSTREEVSAGREAASIAVTVSGKRVAFRAARISPV